MIKMHSLVTVSGVVNRKNDRAPSLFHNITKNKGNIMSTIVNTTAPISLNDFETLALAVGNQTTLYMVGPAGIGKTSISDSIYEKGKEVFGFTHYIYLDCPNLELGEGGIPMPNHETETTTFYPNESWKLHTGEPIFIFLDEFTKGPRAVQNMLHPLINERRFGPYKLHKDSVVVMAGNNSSMGVGDAMAAHTRNRITEVLIRNPLAEEWCAWGIDKIHPLMLAFVKENPEVIESSYLTTEDAELLEIVFNPKKPQKAFFSPRSAHKASNIFWRRDKFSEQVLRTALDGTIGRAATAKFLSFIRVADSLPLWKDIIANPDSASIPDSPAARCILTYSSLGKVDRSNIGNWFKYLKRLPKEVQALFCLSAKDHKKAKEVMFSSMPFIEWAKDNQYLF